jgi:hypothetical protein
VLHEEEARACYGIPPAVAAAAFAGAEVASVEEIQRATVPPGSHSSRGYHVEYLRGAKLTLQGDVNPTLLERSLGCRIARAAADGDDGVDPLAVRGASVQVKAQGEAPVMVEIWAEDQPTAGEVLRRARALAAR